MKNPLSIPLTIEDVTNDWLSEVIGHEVAHFQCTQIGQGVGVLGDIFRVRISYASGLPDGPPSVVVKLPSSFPENRAQGVALGMFEAEVRFYNELASQVSVGLPQVMFADIKSGTAEFVVVMQDLSALSMVEQSIGMNATQAMAAVRQLARVHAAWWGRADDPQFEWIPTMVGPRIEFVDEMLVQILPNFLDGFADVLPDGGKALYESFVGNYLNVNRVLAERSPWTIVHQDYRVENLMFGADGTGEVVVLDWQGIGRGPGAYDLAYLLGGSMATELRRQHEAALLQDYCDELVIHGVHDYSAQQLQEDYGLAQLMGGPATALVVCGSMDLSNERGRQLGATMAARHAQAALDHDGLARLKEIAGK